MMKRNVKRILPLLFVIMMCLMILPSGVYADDTVIDVDKKGSITVTKYATENSEKPGNPATGLGEQTIPGGYNTLDGATFVLFKIADKDAVKDYYNGTSTTSYTLDGFVYTNETTATYDNNPATYIGTQTTSGGGICKFDNLEVGIYVLKEITAPSQITVPLAEDSLISIPMVNTATSSNNGNAKWIYDVNVYPKNHESTGTVELTKVDQNNVNLQNVLFNLYKIEFQSNGELSSTTWEEVNSITNNAGISSPLSLVTGTDGKITLANLPAGLYGTQYKLVETSAPNGYIVNQTPLYFKVNKDNTISWNNDSGEKGDCNNINTGVVGTPTSTTDPKLTITLRNEIPSLTKNVFKNGIDFGTATNQSVNWNQDEEYRLDDTITYSLIAYVPKNVSEITYEITDLPDLGIDDSQNWDDYSVTYADTEAELTDGSADTYTDYSLSAYGKTGNGKGFKLTLNPSGKTATAGKYIQIVYKAHMNASAVIAGNGNGNTATLTYSKFIGGGTGDYTITDEARVYTYQYQITKYKDSVADANKIGNVKFNLLYTENGTAIDVYEVSTGVYRLWLASDTETSKKTKTLVTQADGTILIKGLENGTYYLKETKTIDGYNLLSAPFKIDLNVTEITTWTHDNTFTSTGQVVKTYGSTSYNVTDAKGTSTIINKKGFVLPQTGGMGYLLFCAVGILLIGGGAALIFGGRKKKIR